MIFMNVNDDYSEEVIYTYDHYPIYLKFADLSDYPDHMALAHWHNDIEFIYILSGEMDYNINGTIITIKSGDGLFVNSKRMHFGFSAAKKDCYFLCIRLHPLLLCSNRAYENDFVLPILQHPKLDHLYFHHEIPWQNQILQLLLEMERCKENASAVLTIQGLFLQLWALLFDHIPTTAQQNFPASDLSLLKEMLHYIQCNYQNKISLAQIAESAAIGQSKCCKLFASYIGQSPNLYLTHYRLQKARELLLHTDQSITEIALVTGFFSSSYFTQTFRKQYHITPSQYRNKESEN